MDPSAFGMTLGLEAIKRTAPRGLEWVATYLRGIKMLILGPGGAGKTSISDYLDLGELNAIQPHTKTLDIRKSKTFKILVGRNNSLNLRIRRTIDVPGQTGPVAHADLVNEFRPHVLLVVLDSSTSASALSSWLDPFCERLEHHYRADKRLLRKNRGIFVALNKRDLVARQKDYDARKRRVTERLLQGLGQVLGKQTANAIPVMPTIAVHNQNDSALLDELIKRIAKQISR